MDKQDYEERYGEKVIYCTRHGISGIDGCIACDQEENAEVVEMVTTCVTCHYKSSEDEFQVIHSNDTGKDSLICQTCYDGYMKQVEIVREQNSMKATALADRLNTDYLD